MAVQDENPGASLLEGTTRPESSDLMQNYLSNGNRVGWGSSKMSNAFLGIRGCFTGKGKNGGNGEGNEQTSRRKKNPRYLEPYCVIVAIGLCIIVLLIGITAMLSVLLFAAPKQQSLRASNQARTPNQDGPSALDRENGASSASSDGASTTEDDFFVFVPDNNAWPTSAPTHVSRVNDLPSPTIEPTAKFETMSPSATPLSMMSITPSLIPLATSSVIPSLMPSVTPSSTQSIIPSTSPSKHHSTTTPSIQVSATPSVLPSLRLPSTVPSGEGFRVFDFAFTDDDSNLPANSTILSDMDFNDDIDPCSIIDCDPSVVFDDVAFIQNDENIAGNDDVDQAYSNNEDAITVIQGVHDEESKMIAMSKQTIKKEQKEKETLKKKEQKKKEKMEQKEKEKMEKKEQKKKEKMEQKEKEKLRKKEQKKKEKMEQKEKEKMQKKEQKKKKKEEVGDDSDDKDGE